MSRSITATDIQRLEQSGIIIRSGSTGSRILQEMQALKALDPKNDYLSKYNRILRYAFLLMLKKGFDISGNRVHNSFIAITLTVSEFEKHELEAVVKSRHKKKYAGVLPSKREENILDEVLFIYRQQIDEVKILSNAEKRG